MAATAGQWPLVLQPGGDVADVLQRNGARSADRAPRGGIGSSADGVLLLRRTAALAALTALLVEGSLALLATRLLLRQ
jgi:hypothetical protein